jgi:hypothetical protein
VNRYSLALPVVVVELLDESLLEVLLVVVELVAEVAPLFPRWSVL